MVGPIKPKACFIDFSKAFDKVNYWKLFCQMIDDGNDVCL